MEKKRSAKRAGTTASRTGRKEAAGDGAATIFNDWLETRLRGAYSSVLDEPIPEDLIRLINEKLKD